jgi:hypothetical protein
MKLTIETAAEESVKQYPSGEVVVKVVKEDFEQLKNIILEAIENGNKICTQPTA